MLTPLRRSQPGRAGRLATALAAALILGGSGGPVARAQAMLPRGDWVPSWELLYGGFRQVDDLALVAADSAWGLDRSAFVAGRDTRDQTSFVRWEAGVWRSAQIVNDVSLSRIAIVGSTGFAVGDGGAIFRLIGSSWQRYPSPTGSSLSSLDLAGPADGWAAGTRGTILYWDGGIWRPTAVPDALRLVDIRAVASAGGGRAYAMAASGEVLVNDGTGWQIDATAPRIRRPAAIAFSAEGRGLFLGAGAWELADGVWREAGPDDLVYHDAVWRGSTAYVLVGEKVYRYAALDWSPVELPTGSVVSGLAPGQDGFFALGTQGEVLRVRDGQAAESLWPQANPLEALDAVSDDFGWAGGLAVSAGMVGASDGPWRLAQAMPAGTRVTDLDLASEREGWAVGSAPGSPPEALAWRWDGAAWRAWPVEKTWDLYAVQAISEQEAWLTGSNVVARWDGSDWQQVEGAPFSARFGAFSMLRGGVEPEGWFGAEGEILHLADGLWTAQAIGEGYWVPRLVVSTANEGWAIARARSGTEADRLLRFDGQTWTPVELPIPEAIGLLDVDSPAPGTAWVLVDANGLLHWNGLTWEYHILSPLGASIEPRRVRALRLDPDKRDITVWLAGGRPAVARYRVVEPRQRVFVPLLGQAWRR